MPIHKEGSGYQWGQHGHVYPTKAGAEKQAEAAHANGFHDAADSEPQANELDIARAMQSGELSSPQQFGPIWLFNVRITGTGVSHRTGQGPNKDQSEYVYRTPENFLTPEFLERCNGLPLIFEHPPESAILDTRSFRDRSIGVVILPYIVGDEVWGIAKVYDEDAATLMTETHISTSPSVSFSPDQISTTTLESGEVLRVEGVPSYVDHLAIVPQGVWDKGGDPIGVQ
jgi:hypothetical protein